MLASDIRAGTNPNIALRRESRRNVSDPVLRKRRQRSRRQQRAIQTRREREAFTRSYREEPAEIVPGNSMFPWFRLLFRRGVDIRTPEEKLRKAQA